MIRIASSSGASTRRMFAQAAPKPAEISRSSSRDARHGGRGSRPGRYFTTVDTSKREPQSRTPQAPQSAGLCGSRRGDGNFRWRRDHEKVAGESSIKARLPAGRPTGRRRARRRSLPLRRSVLALAYSNGALNVSGAHHSSNSADPGPAGSPDRRGWQVGIRGATGSHSQCIA